MECEICLNPWNTEKRIPKILSCGHTFCQSCLLEILKDNSLQKTNFKCPSCKIEINSLISNNDIFNLRNNMNILSLLGKMEMQKIKTITPNASISLHINSSNINNESNINNIQKEENYLKNNIKVEKNNNYFENNNNIFPLCQIHKNRANFYFIENNNIIYICNDCLQINEYENVFPLPNLKIQNEYKINSCKNRARILKEEINRVEHFLKSYQDKFEFENNKKIKELFDFIKNIVKYNIATTITLFNQCKKEQKIQIDKKINELNFLRNELNLFDIKLDELFDLNKIKPLPESQIELDHIYNKLGNYINYDNELNLFTMNISIKDEIKNSLFDLIQNSYKIDIDFLKMKNGEIPTIKDLLNKSSNWECNCGNINNKLGKIVCETCSRYRPLETYKNILFNPMFISKTEKKEYHLRRKHEWKVYQSLIKKNVNIMNNNSNINNLLFAIDSSWFISWKCFILNDLTEKILPNIEKNISENKTIGVLPPLKINNMKLCFKDEMCGSFKLNPELKIKKDYILVNQLLWEWFLLNYEGGPVITVENYNDISNIKRYLLFENNLISKENINEIERKCNKFEVNYEVENKNLDKNNHTNSNDLKEQEEEDNDNFNEIKIGIKLKNLFQKNKND